MQAISQGAAQLAVDMFGNYVLQYLFQLPDFEEVKEEICEK